MSNNIFSNSIIWTHVHLWLVFSSNCCSSFTNETWFKANDIWQIDQSDTIELLRTIEPKNLIPGPRWESDNNWRTMTTVYSSTIYSPNMPLNFFTYSVHETEVLLIYSSYPAESIIFFKNLEKLNSMEEKIWEKWSIFSGEPYISNFCLLQKWYVCTVFHRHSQCSQTFAFSKQNRSIYTSFNLWWSFLHVVVSFTQIIIHISTYKYHTQLLIVRDK